MRYDVVIATLNRAESLAKCLAQLEAQTEKPARVVIVDASDDHEPIRARAMRDRDPAIEWEFVESDTKSSPYQRNLGLHHVDSDVVMVPDDDSMLYPEAAAEMMAAYRADEAGDVAGVSLVGVDGPPGAIDSVQRDRSQRWKSWVEPSRDRVEAAVVPKPFATYPQSLWRTRSIPSWIDGDRFALVSSIGGYRLSLRADVVKKHRFDETMGYGIGYALHEDMELSLRLQRLGYLLVGAQRAPVFHDVHPSRRAGGFNYGFCWIANYLYACRMNMPESSPSYARHLPRFLRYKLALYRARAVATRAEYHRDISAGARAAWSARDILLSAGPDELPAAYRSLCDTMIRR